MSQQNNESNSGVLILESLNKEYENLLIEYKLAVSNYINYLKQEVNQSCKNNEAKNKEKNEAKNKEKNNKAKNNSNNATKSAKDCNNKQDMTSIKGLAFWGTSSLSQNNSQTLEECKASCSTTPGCTGATYNLTNGISKCMLRKGDGNIVAGSKNDYAIVPKGQQLLNIVKNINDKLTQVNKKIQKLTKDVEKQFNLESEKRSGSNNDLINQYTNLIEERDKIQMMLNEYQTLDEQQAQGDIYISQNYYSFILLMILVILFIFMLYKFSIPSSQSQSTSTFIQYGGQLGTNAYYIVIGIILLTLLLTYYNKYKLF
jgi:hypothetical protein